MKNTKQFNRKIQNLIILFCICIGVFTLIFTNSSSSSSAQTQDKTAFRVGEKITYNISFEKFTNAAYAEISVDSIGKLEGKEVVELSSKIKSLDFVSAAFYLFDEKRTTFASTETGLPLYIRRISNSSVTPKEQIENYIKSPSLNYDLLTLIYKLRSSGGIGTYTLQDIDETYSFNSQLIGNEKFANDVGEFETIVVSVQSQYLTNLGLSDVKINFSNDEQKIPVLIRFRTKKGKFRAEVASIQTKESNTDNSPTPTPTPTPKKTPTPAPTPLTYKDNQPLNERLPFVLGETLEFKITNQNKEIGNVILQATERKKYLGKDSLLLQAYIKKIGQQNKGVFNQKDKFIAQVDPISLMPTLSEIKLFGALQGFTQRTVFSQDRGIIVINGSGRTQIPVGTHNLLSLAYAIRSFKLKRSRDSKNPVNDTRVAVFLGSQPYVFTLRPSNPEVIEINGQKVSAQLITIRANNRNIDKYRIRLWLGTDKNRLPLRFAFGNYQADLVSTTTQIPK